MALFPAGVVENHVAEITRIKDGIFKAQMQKDGEQLLVGNSWRTLYL